MTKREKGIRNEMLAELWKLGQFCALDVSLALILKGKGVGPKRARWLMRKYKEASSLLG